MHKIINNEYELRVSLNDKVHSMNLIYLHEGLGTIKSWFNLPKNIENLLLVNTLLYNRVPHGKNEHCLPKTYDFFDYQVEELRRIIISLKMNNPVLIGHSDGATISLLYAAKYPDEIKSVVSIAAHIYSEEITDNGVKETLNRYLHKGLKETLEKQHGDNTDAVFYKWYNFWNVARENNVDLSAELNKIEVPVLAMQGDKDEYATDQHLWDIQKNIKNCQAHIIEKCGHFPHVSQSKYVLDKIVNFLEIV